jgi:hypothetical protein
MKKIFLISLFVIFAPLTLVISLFGYSRLSVEQKQRIMPNQNYQVLGSQAPLELYLSNPSTIGSISQEIQSADSRPLLIKNYLLKYNPSLYHYADLILETSDKYGLDHGLILAIAQCESNVCKKIPEGSFNCWGFGNGESRFKSFESAIEYVAKTLKEDYYDEGLITPQQIMPKYVPPSVAKGGPWAKCVDKFLEELR